MCFAGEDRRRCREPVPPSRVTSVGLRRFWSLPSPCGTCYFAPKICSSLPLWLGFTERRLIARRRTLARSREALGWDPDQPPLGQLARGYPSRIKLGVPKIYKIQKSRSPSAASSWSGIRQVLYSITKHAMRRSADEIGATSISFGRKCLAMQHQLLTEFFPPIEFCTTRINRAHGD